MNVVNLHGRLTKEPLIRKTQSGKDVAQFYLAVDSHRKDAQEILKRTSFHAPCGTSSRSWHGCIFIKALKSLLRESFTRETTKGRTAETLHAGCMGVEF